MASEISFSPRQVVKKLIVVLPDRARDVVVSRFGLDEDASTQTLEAIGQKYGITRERVRQIENHSLGQIRRSDVYDEESAVFDELEAFVRTLGGVVSEEELLEKLAKDRKTQNQFYFLLTLGDNFKRAKENNRAKHHWYVDEATYRSVHGALQNLYSKLSDDDLIAEQDIVQQFLDHLKDVAADLKNEEIAKRWLRISKRIDRNPLGEWGRSDNPSVKVKGIRDYAFLVIRKHGSPMHFTEVAERISELFGKKAHVATTHNELIKDNRFVLVGRGLYALTEWGYISGVVKDVIKTVLEKYGPMTRDEIVDKVLRERYVKENTIMVNLQDTTLFEKDSEGRYHIAGE